MLLSDENTALGAAAGRRESEARGVVVHVPGWRRFTAPCCRTVHVSSFHCCCFTSSLSLTHTHTHRRLTWLSAELTTGSEPAESGCNHWTHGWWNHEIPEAKSAEHLPTDDAQSLLPLDQVDQLDEVDEVEVRAGSASSMSGVQNDQKMLVKWKTRLAGQNRDQDPGGVKRLTSR